MWGRKGSRNSAWIIIPCTFQPADIFVVTWGICMTSLCETPWCASELSVTSISETKTCWCLLTCKLTLFPLFVDLTSSTFNHNSLFSAACAQCLMYASSSLSFNHISYCQWSSFLLFITFLSVFTSLPALYQWTLGFYITGHKICPSITCHMLEKRWAGAAVLSLLCHQNKIRRLWHEPGSSIITHYTTFE